MIIIQCPHCSGHVVIEQLNCKIFRHGCFKNNGKQINPHAKKEDCDMYVEKELIFGCGKPFKVIVPSKSSYRHPQGGCLYLDLEGNAAVFRSESPPKGGACISNTAVQEDNSYKAEICDYI